MSGNGFQQSYANEKPPSSTGSAEADINTDPASSGFFTTDFKKHEDLKQMLDSNKDALKLEAMKRVVGMVAKGKDASELFPAVVKNVVSKNLEIKKLVYVYLTRYAEEQQDLALLSISTFQRALKDPNQLIRASALRVLSSVRVIVIAPIMMLAIKEAVMDMSPYVRKTAAHAIPKLYGLDPETKDQLIEVLERLLGDKTTLVAGSAIQAFEEICPERIDLIHKNYRKLCNLLVDVEEWGQVVIINTLTRYARTQFINPNSGEMAEEEERPFYESSGKEDEGEEEEEGKGEGDQETKKAPYIMDPDHRLLLRQAKPLLNSRNSAVVMAVAQLYHHCAPKAEVGTVAKSLIRLLRSHQELQYVVLSNVATMTTKRKGMFEPYLKSFYVRSSDPLHIKLLKLEILTNLATETNISTILREFQTYVTSSDKDFAAATIQAIGRCASTISEVTDTCLNGLVHLMSNRDEAVVAESVVVIKKLLQMRPSEHKAIICHMARMVDKITVPMARASILWLIGEYSERVPKIAPDVLRKLAKSFVNEEDIVKLQVLNLATKLCITNPKQCKLLCQYVLSLAKYDQNYDIRDRSRFLRQMVLPGDNGCVFSKYAKKIFLAPKPAPVLASKFKDRDHFQLGTLSHVLNMRTTGYQELPEWPEEAPDTAVRNVELPPIWEDKPTKPSKTGAKKKHDLKSFYSESESSEEDDSSEDDSSEDDDDEEKGSGDSDAESGSSKAAKSSEEESEEEEEDSSEEEEEEEEDSSEVDSEVEIAVARKKDTKKEVAGKAAKGGTKAAKASADLLLDLDDFGSMDTSGTSSAAVTPGNLLTPTAALDLGPSPGGGDSKPAASSAVLSINVTPKSYDLLHRISGNGLSITYKFTRTISVFSPNMASIELTLTNNSEGPLNNIKLGDIKVQPGMEVQPFPEIATLAVNATTSVLMGVNFNDTTQPASLEVCAGEQKFKVNISASVGELLQPHTMSEGDFANQQKKLGGMNENSATIAVDDESGTDRAICTSVLTAGNLLQVPSSDEKVFKFAAKTLASGTLVLVSVKVTDKKARVTVNSDKMVIGTMLLKDIQKVMEKK
ncbi:AP-3 complex subunit beta-2-like isoform X2 [Littorina saxatilis]|uniref:AP-3 complex subunit beta n=1 Tax=Littorina saxatilis TaxID=31220 RepID=A0AAN9GQA4_9CAEN